MKINNMIKENTKAPNFKLPSTNNKLLSLKDLKDKFVIIYFYPKDDTPGCTVEANDFNKLLPQFKKLNCEIFGISKDNLKSHDKFKEKYKLKFDLLSDEELTVLKKFKVWGKKKIHGKRIYGYFPNHFFN